MAIVDVINNKGKKVSEAELADTIYNIPVKASILHEVVRMQMACRRSGTASVKRRSEIIGSGRKLYRQKGTGRARRGNIKSPLLRGGGVVFGPKPKSYAYSVPKKVKKLALKMALSNKLMEKNIIVLDEFSLDQIKTKQFKEIMNRLEVDKALIVTDQKDEHLEMSSRNVPHIKVMRTEGLNVYDVLKYDYLILLEASLKQIEGRLAS